MGMLRVGLDAGSTAVKAAALDAEGRVVFSRYLRHGCDVRGAAVSVLEEIAARFPRDLASLAFTGTGAEELSAAAGFPFVQELTAEAAALSVFAGGADASVELGGEDAKITFFRAGREPDRRMNRNCAGGTGAFLDQMAAFLGTDAAGLDALASRGRRIYPIASRCGVFAKTDVQGLLNEGAAREDIALSVFQAVVDQTLSGLARGMPLRGRVAFLGGPLTFMPRLLARFAGTLHLSDEEIVRPAHGELFAALGAALSAGGCVSPVSEIAARISSVSTEAEENLERPPLFASAAEYRDFLDRHNRTKIARRGFRESDRAVWLGVDAGSTTLKAAVIGADGAVLADWYGRNTGNLLADGRTLLEKIDAALPAGVVISGAGVTGYGEEFLKAAFRFDFGEVETMAHLRAARFFCPDLTALLDIGGQDMKYIRVKGGVISGISLNGACASGCGSFLESFGETLGIGIREFSRRAVTAPSLLDLGYRCTVLMGAKVRQAQRNPVDKGALLAGLSMAVVKNALYRVIRLADPAEMGERVVVEGGVFYNDAALRSLERVLSREVIRPDAAGLMGAYGMALAAREKFPASHVSSLLAGEEIAGISETRRELRCGGCGNRCRVTVYAFSGGGVFVTGNRCERGERLARGRSADVFNQYSRLRDRLCRVTPPVGKARGTVGMPAALSFWKDFPYWRAFFTALGWRVMISAYDARAAAETAATMPEGIYCHACRLAHAHLAGLLSRKPDFVWMPVMDRGGEEPEIDERRHALYADRLAEAMAGQIAAAGVPFLHPRLPSLASEKMADALAESFPDFTKEEIQNAVTAARAAQTDYWRTLAEETRRTLETLRAKKETAVILCGRDFQLDPQVNKGVPRLFTAEGVPVLSGWGALAAETEEKDFLTLGDETFRGQLLAALRLAEREENLHFVQFQSSGCGYDGLTQREAERRLAAAGKIHTLLSVDQGVNLGAARIRVRSLLAEIAEFRAHPEGRERLKLSAARTGTDADRLFLPPLHPLYDPLLAAAFSADGRAAETLAAGNAETALPFLAGEAEESLARPLAAALRAKKEGRLAGKSALLVLSSARDAAFLADDGFPALYFGGGRRGSALPVTLSLLHRFFAALFLGDFLLRASLASGGNDAKKLRALLPSCAEAVRSGTFAAYEKSLEEIARAARTVSYETENPAVGIAGNPFALLPRLSEIAAAVRKEGGRPIAQGLGEWYADELGRLYWENSFGGNRDDAEACYAARNMAGVYGDAFAAAVETVPGLDPAERDQRKREAQRNRVEHPGRELPGAEADFLRRGAHGILRAAGLADFRPAADAETNLLRKRYPDFPYLEMEIFAGQSESHAGNRVKLWMEEVRAIYNS